MKLKSTILALVCVVQSWGQIDSLKTQEIEAVSVSAISKKEIAYKDYSHYIMDFHIDSNGIFLLLNRFNRYHLYELNYKMEPIIKREIEFHPKELFCDCTGMLYVLSKEKMYPLIKEKDTIKFDVPRPIELLEYSLKDCVASTDEVKIYQLNRGRSQTTEYYQTGIYSGITSDIYSIQDSSAFDDIVETERELNREEERLRRKYSQDEVYQNAPTWEDQTQENKTQVQDFRAYQQRQQFFNDFIVRKPYNPLFLKDDTLYIFDHVNGVRIKLDLNANVIGHSPIAHHKSKQWKREMQLDHARGVFYSVDQSHGAHVFCRLSTDGSRTIRRTKITRHAYPEKVVVYQGYAYYTYREFFDDNLNKLFRQKL